jgi:predicted nuclease of predicted toxin-antitoxin system
VKFLVDAQLPAGLARLLTDAGHDSIHTTALPKDNRTHRLLVVTTGNITNTDLLALVKANLEARDLIRRRRVCRARARSSHRASLNSRAQPRAAGHDERRGWD